jgi:hypothetical protein
MKLTLPPSASGRRLCDSLSLACAQDVGAKVSSLRGLKSHLEVRPGLLVPGSARSYSSRAGISERALTALVCAR